MFLFPCTDMDEIRRVSKSILTDVAERLIMKKSIFETSKSTAVKQVWIYNLHDKCVFFVPGSTVVDASTPR